MSCLAIHSLHMTGCCSRTLLSRRKLPHSLNHWYLCCWLQAISSVLKLGKHRPSRPAGYSPTGGDKEPIFQSPYRRDENPKAHAPTRESTAIRSLCTTNREQIPLTTTREKPVKQRRPSRAKKRKPVTFLCTSAVESEIKKRSVFMLASPKINYLGITKKYTYKIL